jgi:hypothetical protein
MAEPDPLPDLLTIEEAALILRIGRTAAYEQARLWRVTGGQVGIPNILVGRQYRVPRAALEATIGRPITHIPRRVPGQVFWTGWGVNRLGSETSARSLADSQNGRDDAEGEGTAHAPPFRVHIV